MQLGDRIDVDVHKTLCDHKISYVIRISKDVLSAFDLRCVRPKLLIEGLHKGICGWRPPQPPPGSSLE